jgi:hypothetical protein
MKEMSLNTLQVTSVLSFFASCFYMHERITMLLCFVHRTLYMPSVVVFDILRRASQCSGLFRIHVLSQQDCSCRNIVKHRSCTIVG